LVKLNLITILAIIVTFGSAIFATQLLIPFVQFSIDQQDDQAFEQRFFGYGSSQTINVNFTQGDIEGDIERGRQALASCDQAYLNLIYDRDRMNIVIDDEARDATCAMAIREWVGGTYTGLDCALPQEKLAVWDAWTESPDTSQLRDHCKVISSLYVGELVTAE
jgi:hypothetical protein